MRGAFGKPHADLAFINGGTLRIDDYIIGDITFEDIGRTFGYSSYLRYFPQVSGFRVCVDRSRPEGERIVSLQVPKGDDWQELEDEREYGVVVPDFLYRGGDGYAFPPNREASRPGSELVYLVLDAIINAQAEGRSNPRIVILENPGAACWPE
jgi:5'-nucleotidase